MLNKKQFLGLMLLLAAPAIVVAMGRDAGRGGAAPRTTRGDVADTSATGNADDLVNDVEDGVDNAADAAARAAAAAAGANPPSASFLNSMNGFINSYLNAPLNIALTRITALGAKSKLAVSALLLYVGWSASGSIAQDVTTNIPNTVKSFLGADCEDGGCRGGKDDKWTEAA